jgi:hypothetical protein
MDVVRHHHIPNQTKSHLVADLSQLLHKTVPRTRRLQQRQSPVTTERQKVQMLLTVIPLQPARHRSNPRPRYQKTEPGAPSALLYSNLICKSGILSQFTNANKIHKLEPGPPALACWIKGLPSGGNGGAGGNKNKNQDTDTGCSSNGVSSGPRSTNPTGAPNSTPKVSNAGLALAAPVVICEIAEPCGIGLDTIVIGVALTAAAGMAINDVYNHYRKSVPKPPSDPSKPPGPDWEWRGGPKGSWYNPKTGEVLRPDLEHPDPIGPHWDYKDPGEKWWRIFPDGSIDTKK